MKILEISNKNALLILVIICLILPLSWFRPGLIIGGAEENLSFYNPMRSADLFRFTWERHFGSPITAGISRSPAFLFLGLLNQLGIPANILQITTFFLLIFVSAVTMYFLARELLSLSPAWSLLTALFYILNPFMFTSIWHRYLVAMMFFMPLLPLSLYAFQKLIRIKNLMMVPFFLAVSFIFSSAFSLPSNILTLWIVISVFVFGLIVANRFRMGYMLTLTGWLLLFFFSWVLANLWWIGSLSAQAVPEYSQQFSVNDNLFVLRSISQQYSFLNNIILGYPRFLSQGYQILTGYLMLLICLIGLHVLKSNKVKAFFSILLAVSYFFMNGSNMPVGRFFEFLFSNITFLQVFRNPYEKFGITLAFLYSFIFVLGIMFIYKFSRWFSLILLSAIFLILFILPWKGQVFGDPGVNFYVNVPEEYNRINSILNSDTNEFRILHLPIIPGGGLGYKWPKPYFGLTPSFFLFDKISIDGSVSKKEPDLYRRALNEGLHNGRIAQLLKYGNIKYLLFHKDLDYNYAGSESPEEVIGYLSTQVAYLEQPVWYGNLGLYQVKDKYFYPKVYVTSSIENADDWSDLVREGNNPEAFIFPRHKIQDIDYEFKSNETPELAIYMRDPTKYTIKVKNAFDPFWLVFSENFNPNWYANSKGRNFDHFQINGFANGYFVDQTGDFEIQLEYTIQKKIPFYNSLSLISFVVILIASFIISYKKLGSKCRLLN